MLIRRRDNELLLFQQVDHGFLTGELVDLWGNERFVVPKPLDQVRTAASFHDEGWRVPDLEVLFNEAEGRPLSFSEIDQREHVPLYQRGVEEVLRRDEYAGLLVSTHWTGLYRGRWGLQPMPINWTTSSRTPIEQLQDEAIAEQERKWVDIKRQLVGNGFRSDFEANLWFNFDLLQAWDLLSIYVCMNVHTPAPDGAEPLLLGSTLRSLDQVPGVRIIPNVPTAIGGERVDLRLRVVEPGVIEVDPYPFGPREVELSIEATVIPDRRYASQEDARAAVEKGGKVTVTCRMIRP
ncbi:DUF3891 family protein [Streptomyces sp. NPDC001393]